MRIQDMDTVREQNSDVDSESDLLCDPESESFFINNDSKVCESIHVEEEDTYLSRNVPFKFSDLLTPFNGNPGGRDPSSSEEYLLAVSEIDKYAFTDFNAVLTLCCEILKYEGKDLRVAGFLVVANTYISGLRGLIDGLRTYRLLIQEFKDVVYPTSREERIEALVWLNKSKLVPYIKQNQKDATKDIVDDLEFELVILNQTIAKIFDSDTLYLSRLTDWLYETKKQFDYLNWKIIEIDVYENNDIALEDDAEQTNAIYKLDSNSYTELSEAGLSEAGLSEAGLSEAGLSEVGLSEVGLSEVGLSEVGLSEVGLSEAELSEAELSDTELYLALKQTADLLLSEKRYEHAVFIARANLWSNLNFDISDNDITTISPPNRNNVDIITRYIDKGMYESAFKLCESLLHTQSGYLLLDLQYYASISAREMNNINLMKIVDSNTIALLHRMPGIQNYKFIDSTPFASEDTLNWLNALLEDSQNKTDQKDSFSEVGEDCLQNNIMHAYGLAAEQGLVAALEELSTYRTTNEKDHFLVKLAMAQICLEHNQASYALPLLEELYEDAERYFLAKWDKELALSVTKSYQTALRHIIQEAKNENMAIYLQKEKALSAKLCRLDLLQAVKMI